MAERNKTTTAPEINPPSSGEIALGLVLVRDLTGEGITYSEICLATGMESIRGVLNRIAARLGVKLRIVGEGRRAKRVFVER